MIGKVFIRLPLILVSALLIGFPKGLEAAETLPAQPQQGLILKSAEQIHLLTREEAGRGHRAIIRGVVTCSLPGAEAVVLQDSSRGIYVDQIVAGFGDPPEIGELLEIEGVTDPGEFAPQLHARALKRLGRGELPHPIHPTWDQLINGSLDTQFVELRGIVTAVRPDGLTLLTHGGKINTVVLRAVAPLTPYENSLIRIKGCLFASWDPGTHQVRIGEIRMFSPLIEVEEPAPADVFGFALKRAPELLLFDPQASALKRVKLSGQIVHQRHDDFYMMDGTNGVRFVLREPSQLQTGDLVEVVGFPSLLGPSPLLREAVARKVGSGKLPEPRKLNTESLFRAEHDATRVRVEGTLLSWSADGQTMEMQAGLRRFQARINPGTVPVKRFPLGSRLELTGVYAGLGGNRTIGAEVGSFELLLNASSAIRLLAKPPFWTFPRLIAVVGALMAVLIGALVWIRLLHHQVRERTAQLGREIREREHADHQRVRAQERARIARDLHDDLGSSLTEITMLATANPGSEMPSDESSERLDLIAGKSRTMVHALDEIVWAIDPQRDTLASLARYLASYVEEYLAGLNVACRVQLPNSFPDRVVSGEVRHHLFLAVKETLNNAVRHSRASEIGFRVMVLEDGLRILIKDNGSGFDLSGRSNGHGLLNLHNRLEKLSGRCDIDSAAGAGTTVSLQLPLNENKNGV